MPTYLSDESGAASVEYAILVSAIAIGIVAIALTIGGYTAASYDSLSDEFAAVGSQAAPD